MALLVGEVRGLPEGQVSTYDVFHRLATSPDTRDKVALVADTSSITYKQLLHMVYSLHLWLRRNLQEAATRSHPNLQSQEDRSSHEPSREPLQASSTHLKTHTTIALCLPRSPELVALILAIWKQGWAYVPLDPSVPALRTLYVVRDAEPACVVTDAHTSIKIRQLECDTAITPQVAPVINPSLYSLADRILDIGDWDGNSSSTDAEDMSCDSNVRTGDMRVACILYTSGSTGNPKGVLLTMVNLMNRLHWQWQELPYTEGEMCLMSKSLTFVDSLTELMGPLLGGVPVVVMREEAINPELVIRYVSQHSVTRLVLVPSLLKLLLLYLNTTKDSIAILQRNLRIWITSGEMLPGWLINDFYAMFPGSKFINLYGSTEVTGDVSCNIIEEVNWRAGVKVPVGRPVSNTALLVVRQEGGSFSLARKDQPGEIVVLGKNVCAGYLNGKLHRDRDDSFLPVSSIEVQDEGLRAKLEDFISRVCGNKVAADNNQEAAARAHNNAPSAGHCHDTQDGEDLHSIPSVSISSAQESKPQESSQSPTAQKFKSSLGRTFQPALAPRPGQSPTPPAVPPRSSTPPSVPRRTPRPPHKTADGSAIPSKTPASPKTQVSSKTTLGYFSKTLAGPTSNPATRTRSDSPQVITEPQIKATAYRTGDLGRVVGGQLVVEGRSDLQVKVRGVRVHLTEVEDAVHRSGYAARQCVVAARERPAEDEEEVLAAFVVLKEEFEDRDRWVTEDLGRCLRGYLPRGIVPRLLVVDALPQLPSGKIDRQALLALYHKRMGQRRTSTDDVLILRKVEPIESRVLRIICGALGVSRSQDVLQKNFFELGGSSITSVGVVVRLRDLGLDVTLDAFLKAATIGEVVSDILKAKTMAEVMNLFSSPSPSTPSTAPSHVPPSGREEEGDGDEEEEGRAADMSIPALHPDLPMSASRAKHQGLRLAQLHTLPVSQGVDKHMVIEMVAESFTSKNPLDVTLRVPRAAHHSLLNLLWPRLVHDDLSFVVKDPQHGVLGAVINTDFFNEPQMLVPASMEEIAALHHPLEEEARHLLRQEAGDRGVRWVHNLFLATSTCLKPQDNVRLVLHLEKELIRMAQTKLYHGVFTVNSNPLNQLLCENYLGYQRRGAVRVSSFVHKGCQPFASLPHDLLLVAMTKTI